MMDRARDNQRSKNVRVPPRRGRYRGQGENAQAGRWGVGSEKEGRKGARGAFDLGWVREIPHEGESGGRSW